MRRFNSCPAAELEFARMVFTVIKSVNSSKSYLQVRGYDDIDSNGNAIKETSFLKHSPGSINPSE